MPLTNTAIKNAKPAEKTFRLFDEKGLYLEVAPSGGKWWRFKYRYARKEKRLSLGTYPDVFLADARERWDAARKLLAQGVDPGVARKEEQAISADDARTFGVVALEWYEKQRPGWTESTSYNIMRRLERELLPPFGTRPIKTVAPKMILEAIAKIDDRGCHETARRALQCCGQIFRYAVVSGYVENDPTPSLRGALMAVVEKHRASITDPKAVGPLLRALWEYEGSPITACALRLAPLTFVRPGELRHAEWSEFDIDAAEWRIPGHKMKMKEQHVVPLSRQALAVLNALRPITGGGRYLFPSERTAERPMSENTVNGALRRLGYSKEEMTGHGFRSMASTLLNEQGWNRDAIERQLAHAERNGVRAAYNYAEFLPERRKMMQAWAEYLDALREGGKVTPLFAVSAGA
ncbi:MAG: integrase [Desulfovibrionaceae bacterium CG1_02_65_16]|nr:MAG: integrase [Desulfovibrionaceae bacterium CG1_02_65_16]